MRYFIVDAFTDTLFAGNQAGVCIAPPGLPEAVMQQIAAENNLAETAFVTGSGGTYDLRWFTPLVEVDLCGHATLATAYVIATILEPGVTTMRFATRSGELTARAESGRITLDFPARPGQAVPVSPAMADAVGAPVREAWLARDLMLVVDDEATVAGLNPDPARIAALAQFGVVVTAPGTTVDFVSRFFAPNVGIFEDPVTGSTHTTLVPYWARRLGTPDLVARQLSARGGTLYCRLAADRVEIAGHAVLYLHGDIEAPILEDRGPSGPHE